VIRLTRLNGSQFYLNAEHIQALEATPDTHILLTNGQQYVVREAAARVAELVLAYQRSVRGVDHLSLAVTHTGDEEAARLPVPFPGRDDAAPPQPLRG
jgi:flagellar protein FlbD